MTIKTPDGVGDEIPRNPRAMLDALKDLRVRNCPKCGAAATESTGPTVAPTNGAEIAHVTRHWFFVCCTRCGDATVSVKGAREAIFVWNRTASGRGCRYVPRL